MPCHSSEMQDPPQVDVVVSETLGNYALEENIIETLADAAQAAPQDRRRGHSAARSRSSSRPSFRIASIASCAPGTSVGQGLDLSPAKAMSFNNAYVRTFEPRELLDDGKQRAGVGRGRVRRAKRVTAARAR